MARRTTIDHEKIREWIEKNGGVPAIVRDETGESTARTLTISFGASVGLTEITWEEFFTIFEAERLAFTYDGEFDRENMASAFAFVNREKQRGDLGENEETEFPEDRSELDENIFPSNE